MTPRERFEHELRTDTRQGQPLEDVEVRAALEGWDRAVRNHLIAMMAVEEAFAGWELRERYRQVPGAEVASA